MREHIRPIHLNIPVGKTPKQQPPKPEAHSPVTSHIPKPNPSLKSVYQPKKYLPQPSLHPPSCIPKLVYLPKPLQMPSAYASPVLSNFYSTCLPSTALSLPLMLTPCNLSCPQALDQHLLHLAHWRRLAWRVLAGHPQSHPQCPATLPVTLQASSAATLPVVPAPQHLQHPPEYESWGCPSHTMRQPWADSTEGPRLGHFTTCPPPFPLVMRSHQPAPTLMSRSHQLQKLRLILPPAQGSYHQQADQMVGSTHRPGEGSPT